MGKKKLPVPQLTEEQFERGDNECYLNARRLIEDAELLGEQGRYRTGYIVALHASEELGKALLLDIAITDTNTQETRDGWWEAFTDHKHKQGTALLAWVLINQREEYEKNWNDIHRRIDDAMKRLFDFRNHVMYVDFDEKKSEFIPVPQDDFMKKHFEEELNFAKLLLKRLAPKT